MGNKKNLLRRLVLPVITTLAVISATGFYFTREETIARNGRTNSIIPTWKYVWDTNKDGKPDTTFVKIDLGPINLKYKRNPTKREVEWYRCEKNLR